MPLWISQKIVTADTPRNHSRTAWLDPLQARIQDAIRNYVRSNPGGDTVTLSVFEQIPPADVQKLLPRGRTIDAGRRELGLRVPLELIAMYGASRVETLRRDDGRTASPRRTKRDWPRNFTPHRVTVEAIALRPVQGTAFHPGFPQEALWTSIFASWLEVVADYRESAGDLSWQHGAAASVSLLSGALWRLPGAVLLADPSLPPRSTRPSSGRIWFNQLGSTLDIATTVLWPQTPAAASEALCRSLDHAAWQLRASRPPTPPAQRFVVGVIIPALVGAGRTVDEAAALLDAAWEGLEGPAGMARYLAWDDPLALEASGGHTLPGVMLVAQAVD